MIKASKLWFELRHRHPEIDVIDHIEGEVFSDFPTDYPAWIGDDPFRLLARIESRAINNGIGAGRGGGPIMTRVSQGCYALFEDGMALVGEDAEGALREAQRALNERDRQEWERRQAGDRPVRRRKGWFGWLSRHRPAR
jgi:hypothetical protein